MPRRFGVARFFRNVLPLPWAVGASFEPDDVAGLRNDWNAALGVAGSGTAVATWTDQKSGGVEQQTTALNQPTWNASDADFNGLPCVTYDGVNSWTESTEAAANWAFLHNGAGATIFAVERTLGTGDQFLLGTTQVAVFKLGVAMNDARYAPIVTRSPQTIVGNGAATQTDVASSAVPDRAIWFCMRTSAGGLGVQNVLDCSSNAAVTGSLAASLLAPQTTLRIGRPGASGLRWNGKLARLLVYSRAISDSEVQQLRSYAVSRYGVLS